MTTPLQCHFIKTDPIANQLERFWKIEERTMDKIISAEDKKCEELFQKSITRFNDGKFMVQMPLKESPEKLGESKLSALQRLQALEKRFKGNQRFKQTYQEFMTDYNDMNMSECEEDDNGSLSMDSFYLPHHGVFNQNNQTTKLRVVFDGSAKSDSGWSLNELQYIGPTIQDELFSIVVRFRFYRYAVCADIKKMYRQIWIERSQRNLQKILWRNESDEPIKTYKLNTVTYGTTSAPFLAVRCLKQLSTETKKEHPEASRVIASDFYVDDLITGGDSIRETSKVIKEIISILSSAKFELHKWISNSEHLLNEILVEPNRNDAVEISDGESSKTLGLYWFCKSDYLFFKIGELQQQTITERSILLDIAQIFDPLGLLSPCVIISKMILQRLWQEKLSWDESLPLEIYSKWDTFRSQLSILNTATIQRSQGKIKTVELHGVADASQEAYGACIYVRSVNTYGQICVHLLCAKTRVAPIKPLTTLLLELCGCLILAQLMNKIISSLRIDIETCYLWSDSSVALHWIKTPANLLQTFVGNRVLQIQELTQPNDWYHVNTKENPADLLSRGVNPKDLINNSLWWHGPDWLMNDKGNWSQSNIKFEGKLPELKSNVSVLISQIKTNVIEFQRFITTVCSVQSLTV
ncbi:uncharacterized protein [Onthophagus taurus]|uniref:uncharacterized protein n=1 Tax=Onthophagus taurus TaxID=166361 RepID=UPI0039BE3B4B